MKITIILIIFFTILVGAIILLITQQGRDLSTSKPTMEPTMEPTIEPTIEPTMESTDRSQKSIIKMKFSDNIIVPGVGRIPVPSNTDLYTNVGNALSVSIAKLLYLIRVLYQNIFVFETCLI